MIEIVKSFNVFCWFRDIKQLNECTVVYQMFAYVKMLYLHHNYNHIISVYICCFPGSLPCQTSLTIHSERSFLYWYRWWGTTNL